MECTCPLETFPEVSDVTCKENFGQIQKLIFCDMREINTPGHYADPTGAADAYEFYLDPYDNYPLPSLLLTNYIHGGYEEPDYYEFTLQFKPNYSDNLFVVPWAMYSGLDLANRVYVYPE